MDALVSRLEQLCLQKGLKMTEQRRVVCRVLSDATDHPDVEDVFKRAVECDPKISLATVYRTMRLLEEVDVIRRLDFGDGRARFEENRDDHHDHLIDISSGRVIEFKNAELEEIKRRIAEELGFNLVDHRLELYAVPIRSGDAPRRAGGAGPVTADSSPLDLVVADRVVVDGAVADGAVVDGAS